jgi:hypothetical protein
LNEAVEALGSLQSVLGNIDLSELRVAMKIKKKIAKLKEELRDEIKDHEIFAEQDSITVDDVLEAKGDFEEDLFKEGLESLSYGGHVGELQMYDVESLIDSVNDLGRTIRRARREISDLQELLK